MNWDYVIVGGGTAGCVLADRLSENPANTVILLEAGPEDKSTFIHMPRGAAKLYSDPSQVWFFPTASHDEIPQEIWLRGKVLGGSSSINGMMYFRGQADDYDEWERLGATGWGWNTIEAAFKAMEHGEGDGGPLKTSIESEHTPLTEAFIAAGENLGVPRVFDLNRTEGDRVGYTTRTIWKGKRQSSAQAFLKRARVRPNLRIATNAFVDTILFQGKRATGVRVTINGRAEVIRSGREVIISAGALMSPQILQRSGVGSAEHLRSLGIDVLANMPGVGEHLLEHRLLMMHYDLAAPISDNPQLRGLQLAANVARYYFAGKGAMTKGYGTAGAFVTVLPESRTPDVEILLSPTVAMPDEQGKMIPDKGHSVTVFGYPLRSRSEGSVRITSADPTQPAEITAGYLRDPYDQMVTLAMHRYLREWMAQPSMKALGAVERKATRSLVSDVDILRAFRTIGQAGYHACGTCRMGNFDDAVLDEKLRVRGLAGLRVVDGSIMPTMVSANTNGPIMASAWHAADLILEGRNF